MSPRRLKGLYLITPEAGPLEGILAASDQALRAGAAAVQLRDKGADPARRRELGRGLLALCRASGALLIINDDPALALELGADGVHVGRDDCPAGEARAILGAGPLLGVSCYADPLLARAAVDAGADHVAFGSFYPSSTKPGARPAPLDVLSRARALVDVPLVAIGGISAANARPLVAAGADALAVCAAVYGAADPAAAAAELAGLWP